MPWGYTKMELAADNTPGSGSWYPIALSCLATAVALTGFRPRDLEST